MFYVLIFGLLAVVLVVVALSTMSRRRRNLGAEEARAAAGHGHAAPGPHGPRRDAASRRNRKATHARVPARPAQAALSQARTTLAWLTLTI